MLQPTPAEFLAQLYTALDEGEAMLKEIKGIPNPQLITAQDIEQLEDVNEKLRKLIVTMKGHLHA